MAERQQWMLALETSGDICSVALLSSGELREEVTFKHNMHLSERLMDIINQVLKNNCVVLEQICSIAVGVGPGSFTGTRIGVTTAKTLSLVLHCPLYGISTLAALAEPFYGLESHVVACVLPCRKSVVFAAAYHVRKSVPSVLLPPEAREIEQFLELLMGFDQPVLLCGEGSSAISASMAEHKIQVVHALQWPSAQSVGRLAYARHLSEDGGEDPITLAPAYLAPPPISQPKVPIPQHSPVKIP